MNDEAEQFICCALRHQFASKPLRLYAYQRRSIFLSRGCWRQALRSVCWHNKRTSGLCTVNSHPAVLCLLYKTLTLAETLDVRNSKNDQLLKAVKPVNILAHRDDSVAGKNIVLVRRSANSHCYICTGISTSGRPCTTFLCASWQILKSVQPMQSCHLVSNI